MARSQLALFAGDYPVVVPSGSCAGMLREHYADLFKDEPQMLIQVQALAAMVHKANQVADKLAAEGISVEVVDPRTVSPLDEDGILESVTSTGRVVIVDESAARLGFAHDLAALIATKAFYQLKAPIIMVTPPHTPVPFSPVLEQAWIPSADRIEAAVRKVMEA